MKIVKIHSENSETLLVAFNTLDHAHQFSQVMNIISMHIVGSLSIILLTKLRKIA